MDKTKGKRERQKVTGERNKEPSEIHRSQPDLDKQD